MYIFIYIPLYVCVRVFYKVLQAEPARKRALRDAADEQVAIEAHEPEDAGIPVADANHH